MNEFICSYMILHTDLENVYVIQDIANHHFIGLPLVYTCTSQILASQKYEIFILGVQGCL